MLHVGVRLRAKIETKQKACSATHSCN